jgi:PKD repeat protein
MEGGSFVGSPAVSGGKLFVPVIGDHLADPAYGYAYVYAFDEFTGNILWQSIKMGSLYSTPAVAYGKAFIGSYDGNIYAFNESDGSLLWSYVTGDRIETSSPAVASGMVFVGSDDGYVYAFDQKNGEVIWRYKTGHWVCSSPAIVDGIVYVGSLDGNVYAIGSAPTPPVQEWLFDGDFQYNLDNNYGTVEGTGHLSGKAALSAGSLSIGGQITINGPLPTTVPEVYLIATDGPDKELAKQAVDLSGFSYWQTGTNTYNFTGQIPNVIQPINNGHYEAQALITYNTAKYEFFVNTASLINSHYFPLTTPPLKFRIGDWVQTTANLNVREGPGLNYTIISTMPLGTIGQIVGGPVEADGYIWWDVKYVSGERGWSVEDGLTIAVPNKKPRADFGYAPLKPKAGEIVTFNASSSYDEDGEIISYQWDWNNDNDTDDYTDSPIATFWWPEAGLYEVSLTVVDDKGAINSTKKEIFIDNSAESRIILAGWGANPSWTMLHWDDHKRLVKIDDLLREGEKRLSWLPSEFSYLEEPEIVSRLNVEIDHSLAPGLTYLDYAFISVCEAELVNDAWWQSTPQYYYKAIPLLVKYGLSSIWSLLVSKEQIVSLVAKVSPLAGLVLAIGFSSMSMAAGIRDVKDLIDFARKQAYSWGLGYYFNLRDSWDHDNAWSDPVVQSFIRNSIEDGATDEQKNRILQETGEYFSNLWTKYNGDYYYDAATAHNDKGFPPELKSQIRKDIKNLIVHALEESNYVVSRKIVSVASPVELRISDSQGRITGVVEGVELEEIPNSIYDNETKTAIIFLPSDYLRYEVVGTDTGTYILKIISIQIGQIINFTAINIPTSTTAIHQYTIDWDALAQGEEGVTVQIDSDGNGVFEHTFTSDNELNYDDFMLQTATTIDIDPDVLNLKSKGKWITAYIEFPEGYNVSDIDVSSILLNGTIPVDLNAPTAIGDYDGDGVPDLMVKFNRTAVCEFILSKGIKLGNVTLTVSGKLRDGTEFEGCDTIRVRMPGDLNMDGKVDMKDIVLAARAFGEFPGRPRWNPMADENEDGIVDLRDIALIARNFGKTYE